MTAFAITQGRVNKLFELINSNTDQRRTLKIIRQVQEAKGMLTPEELNSITNDIRYKLQLIPFINPKVERKLRASLNLMEA